MKRSLWLVVPAVLAAVVLARPLWSEEGSDGGGGAQEMPEPGEVHKQIAKVVGKWKVAGKFWMGPGEPTATESTAVFKVIMDGWFVQQDFSGDFMGKKFLGMGIDGYNEITKQYTSHWCDNMGGISMFMTGASKDGGKTIEYKGEAPSAQTGGMVKMRSVITNKSDDSFVMEMYDVHEKEETKTMELTYTRSK